MLWGNDIFANHWKQLHWLQDEVQNWLENYEASGTQAYPPANMWSNDAEVLIAAEVPGIKSEHLDINVEGQLLTLRGKRTVPGISEGEKLLKQERVSGDFNRTFQLPFAVELEQIEAALKNGILQIRLPRAESDKPRKIKVVAS